MLTLVKNEDTDEVETPPKVEDKPLDKAALQKARAAANARVLRGIGKNK